MCTVTYIPLKDAAYFTSNRDEKNRRTPALPPAVYDLGSGKAIYPKDGSAGGTWIAGHENGNLVIFLNGGFSAHTPDPPYRKSRGLILLDLIDHQTPFNCFMAINLNRIEPFTAVMRDNSRLFECRWDGSQKHYQELDETEPKIWSSATLYDEEVRTKREKWFRDWIVADEEPTQSEILHFHQFTGDGDSHNDLRMNRDGAVYTVSITSVEMTQRKITMDYLDLQNNETYTGQLMFETSIAGR